jgi:hypothetical protein
MTTFRKKQVKVWTEAELQKENLDFSFTADLSLPEVVAVWYWELDRELGTVIEPFILRPKPTPASMFEDPNHEIPLPLGLKYHKLGSLLPLLKPSTDSLKVHGPSRSRIHAFEINWDVPLHQIVAAFQAWGEKQSVHRGDREYYDSLFSEPKRGRKDFCDAWLGELRIYRISAVLNYMNGVQKLKDLGIIGQGAQIDASNWSHAIRRSRERINNYKSVVESLPPWNGPREKVAPDSTLAWRLLESFGRASIQRALRSRRLTRKQTVLRKKA